MKKVISFVLASVMAISLLSVCAFAASGINANEQKILDSLSEKIVVNGKEVAINASLINQAKNYILRDGVNVSEAETSEILGYIAEAKTAAKTSDTVSGNNFSAAVNNKIIALAEKAAAVLNLTVAANPTDNSVTIKDAATGEIVSQSTQVIKKTGASLPVLPMVVVFALFAMSAAGAVCVKKFSL